MALILASGVALNEMERPHLSDGGASPSGLFFNALVNLPSEIRNVLLKKVLQTVILFPIESGTL